MRQPKYLSPSSISKFYSNREQFYLQYLCEHRNPRPPQVDYMAVGSGFDAFVKHQIFVDVHGPEAVKGTEFEFSTIFENQVEAHIRTKAMKIGTDVWNQYVSSGAYGNLRDDIVACPLPPKMEWRLESEIHGVPMLGLPDLRYVTKGGVHVICDFKVNGSCSKSGASPFQGYKVCWDDYSSMTCGKAHKKYEPMALGDVEINKVFLETFCTYWADQLATYAWLLEEEVGSESFVIRMEQLCMRRVKTRGLPRGKFATHMNRVSKEYQIELLGHYQSAWETITSGHIFSDLPREQSDARCRALDSKAKTPKKLFPSLHQSANDVPRFFQPKKI